MLSDWEKCLTHHTTAVNGDEPPDFGDPAEGGGNVQEEAFSYHLAG